MTVTRITLSVPTPHLSLLVSNMLGLAGLIAVVVAVGGLTGNWWWSLAAAGVFAVGLAWVANTHAQRAETETEAEGDAVRLRPASRAAPAQAAA